MQTRQDTLRLQDTRNLAELQLAPQDSSILRLIQCTDIRIINPHHLPAKAWDLTEALIRVNRTTVTCRHLPHIRTDTTRLRIGIIIHLRRITLTTLCPHRRILTTTSTMDQTDLQISCLRVRDKPGAANRRSETTRPMDRRGSKWKVVIIHCLTMKYNKSTNGSFCRGRHDDGLRKGR